MTEVMVEVTSIFPSASRGGGSRECQELIGSKMPRKPPAPTSWDIYLARHTPANWIDIVEAADANAVIAAAAREFKVPDPRKLIAVQRG